MTVLIYLLKLVLCSALFYGYYHMFLRNRRIHLYNRFYLMAAITLSIVLPLLQIPLLSTDYQDEGVTKTLKGIAFGGWEKEIIVTAKHGFITMSATLQNMIISLYIAGFFITIFPVIKSLEYVRALSVKHKATVFNNIWFYDTTEQGTPFSFFNAIFWNSNIPIETKEGQQILRHELYHIKQRHSYDVLFMQLTCSVLWFNPFCYLLTKELKMIHEFLADEYTAAETDKHDYAKMLVMQVVSPRQVLITNQFFYNQIKRRITMLLQSNNTCYSYIRKIMTIPVMLIIFCACSVKNKEEVFSNYGKSVDVSVDKVYVKPEVEAAYPGDGKGWIKFLNKNFRYPKEAQELEIQGTVILEFTVEKDGSLTNIKTVEPLPTDRKGSMAGIVVAALRKDKKIINVQATKEQGEILKKEAVRVLTQSGKWMPAKVKGEIVASIKRQPITFKLEAE